MSNIDFQPYSKQFAANPYPVYRQLREQAPAWYFEDWGVTLFSRHEDISALLVHNALGRTLDNVLTTSERQERAKQEPGYGLVNYTRFVSRNLLETEGEHHIRLRRLLVKGFSRSRVGEQREQIQALADALFADAMAVGEFDLLEDIATPLSVQVIGGLLGMPPEDQHLLRPWSADIVRLYEKDATRDDRARAEQATTEFVDYIVALIEARRASPRDDLLSSLVQVEDEGDALSNDELIATAILLLNAGHESTVNAAGNGVLALLRNPGQLALLQARPELAASAVEEVLRYDAPLQYFHRYVLTDFEYAGKQLHKGDTIGLLYGAGNHDPGVFQDPDHFDITRQGNRHLAFGKGRHFCLGAPLARLELEVIFNTLLSVIPEPQLAGDDPQFQPGLVFRGLKSLCLKC